MLLSRIDVSLSPFLSVKSSKKCMSFGEAAFTSLYPLITFTTYLYSLLSSAYLLFCQINSLTTQEPPAYLVPSPGLSYVHLRASFSADSLFPFIPLQTIL